MGPSKMPRSPKRKRQEQKRSIIHESKFTDDSIDGDEELERALENSPTKRRVLVDVPVTPKRVRKPWLAEDIAEDLLASIITSSDEEEDEESGAVTVPTTPTKKASTQTKHLELSPRVVSVKPEPASQTVKPAPKPTSQVVKPEPVSQTVTLEPVSQAVKTELGTQADDIQPKIEIKSEYRQSTSTDDVALPLEQEPRFELSKGQQKVIDAALSGESLFYTGAAGTGKSFVLKKLIEELREIHGPYGVCVTATTGLAALNIGGETVHRWAGVRLGEGPVKKLYYGLSKSAQQRWLETNVLIIDEVSMLDGRFFKKLSNLGKMIYNNDRPFGGIQVILTGDFFQLPPVPDLNQEKQFLFQSSVWSELVSKVIIVNEVFRQKDPEFIDLLNNIRVGARNIDKLNEVAALCDNVLDKDAIHLYGTKKSVRKHNETEMDLLKGSKVYSYESIDTIYDEDIPYQQHSAFMNQNFMVEKELELKVGAQVMLVRNLTPNLVNGSVGTVITFACEGAWQDIQSEYGMDIIPQYNRMIASGEMPSPSNQNLMELWHRKNDYLLPIVKFENGVIMAMSPVQFERSDATGTKVVATRQQIPLILAWALTIHKSQGQTLPKVVVHCSDIFEFGQLYVALSRSTGLEGLQVLGFQRHKITSHPAVQQFYSRLTEAA